MKISVLRVLAVLFFVWACPAKADLRFCNETGQKVDIAIAWHGDGDWHSSGWYKYAPGECASIVDGDLTSRYYWYYAEVAGGLKWSGDGDPNSGFFCTQQAKFRYRNANQTTCEGYTFKRIDTGESQNYTRRLTETRTEPLGAAIKCQDQIGRGRNEFIKCWMRNVGTSKQQEILKCFDATKTYAAFAICANKDQLSDSEYKIANCADEYMRTRVGGEFLTCVANGQFSGVYSHALQTT